MDLKICVFALFLFTVCYGQDSHTSNQRPTSKNPLNIVGIKQAANQTLTSFLTNNTTNLYRYDDYDDYNYRSSSRGVVIGVPIVSLLLIACCVYFCCRCRTQRNQGIVMTSHPPPQQPVPPAQIIIQQHTSPAAQPMAGFPPTYPPQQHVPPPYDTQPMWNPPPQQQQFHQNQAPPHQQFNQQVPTSYDNPNYGQPPLNPNKRNPEHHSVTYNPEKYSAKHYLEQLFGNAQPGALLAPEPTRNFNSEPQAPQPVTGVAAILSTTATYPTSLRYSAHVESCTSSPTVLAEGIS